MRVVYLIDEMEAITAGGTERQVLQMVRLLQAGGAEISLATLRGTEWLTVQNAGCLVEHFHVQSYFHPAGVLELWRLYRWLRKLRPDLLQSFFVESNILGPIIGKVCGVPVRIGSRRNLNYWMGWRTALAQRLSNLCVTRLQANCQAVKDFIMQSEKVPAEKVAVVYNGIDLALFQRDTAARERIRVRLEIEPGETVVGMVASLRPIKGTEDFVEAASTALRQAPQARFVLVGDGPLRLSLEARVRARGLTADRFIFAGGQERVEEWLHAFDIGVLASHSEGFSNSILEYMAAGLAIVATDVGGNREALGNAGILVTAGDLPQLSTAIVRLIQGKVERQRLSDEALHQVNRFSLESAQASLFQQYTELLTVAMEQGTSRDPA